MKKSLAPEADQVLLAAERANERRQNPGITFRSARRALEWFYEKREAMSHPKPPHGAGREVGVLVVLSQVDGGRGGDHPCLDRVKDGFACGETVGA